MRILAWYKSGCAVAMSLSSSFILLIAVANDDHFRSELDASVSSVYD